MNATQMEEMLRDALQARAAEVTQVASTLPAGRGRARPRPWLIPLAAAAAVVALLGAVFVGRSVLAGDTGDTGDGPSPAGPAPTGVLSAEAPAAFLGIRDGALVRYATATGAPTIVVAVNPGTTVSSATIAADGTVYYTVVTINDSSSGQLWRIPPGAQPQLMLDPDDWAPRSVTVHDQTLAVESGSRSGQPGSASDDGIVLISTLDGAEIRRISGSAADGDLQAMQFLADGRLAVLVSSGGLMRTMYVVNPASAAVYEDGTAIPVDPGWQVSAIGSGPDGVVVAFWSGASVEVNQVDPASFVSTRTLYASSDGEVVTNLSVDPQSGAVLAARDRRYGGAPVDASSVPVVLLDGQATPVPGLEPPATPPIDVVRIVGWVA